MPYFKLDLEDGSMAVVHVHKANYPYNTGEVITDGVGYDVSVSWQRYYQGWGNKWVYVELNSYHSDFDKIGWKKIFKFNNTIYEIEINDIVNVSFCSRKFYHENKELKEEPKKNSYIVRDSQKGRMYGSERFYNKKQTLYGEEVGIYFDLIYESELYIKLSSHFTQYADTNINVVLKERSTQYATATAFRIVLPDWSRNELVILHELSHVIIRRLFSGQEIRERKIQGHGKEFCFIFALLVKEFMNEHYNDLIKGYNAWKVKYLTEMIGMSL